MPIPRTLSASEADQEVQQLHTLHTLQAICLVLSQVLLGSVQRQILLLCLLRCSRSRICICSSCNCSRDSSNSSNRCSRARIKINLQDGQASISSSRSPLPQMPLSRLSGIRIFGPASTTYRTTCILQQQTLDLALRSHSNSTIHFSKATFLYYALHHNCLPIIPSSSSSWFTHLLFSNAVNTRSCCGQQRRKQCSTDLAKRSAQA